VLPPYSISADKREPLFAISLDVVGHVKLVVEDTVDEQEGSLEAERLEADG